MAQKALSQALWVPLGKSSLRVLKGVLDGGTTVRVSSSIAAIAMGCTRAVWKRPPPNQLILQSAKAGLNFKKRGPWDMAMEHSRGITTPCVGAPIQNLPWP